MATVNLVMCGSFSPITYAHLRSMEIAKDALNNAGIEVNRGILSPVSDGYKKKDLVAGKHRAAMISAAIKDSDWLELSTWEIDQEGFTLTYQALQEIKKLSPDYALLMVGGADLLDSMTTPNVWSEKDIEGIISEFGLVIVGRIGFDIVDIISKSETLNKHESNIHIASENVLNSVSSTHIRTLIRAKKSVKYLTPDAVIDYIRQNNLWSNDL